MEYLLSVHQQLNVNNMYINKYLFILLLGLVIFLLVLATWIYTQSPTKHIVDCSNVEAAKKTLIQAAKNNCDSGWEGTFRMSEGELTADCN